MANGNTRKQRFLKDAQEIRAEGQGVYRLTIVSPETALKLLIAFRQRSSFSPGYAGIRQGD